MHIIFVKKLKWNVFMDEYIPITSSISTSSTCSWVIILRLAHTLSIADREKKDIPHMWMPFY